MTEVRIAWYSNQENDVYHLCQNCHYNQRILPQHLVAGTEQAIIDDLCEQNPDENEVSLLCERCKRLLRNWSGIILVIPVG